MLSGPATKLGEFALGKNVTVDSCLGKDTILKTLYTSERCVTDDVFTSVHIEEHEWWQETKLGAEEITRDIPNGEESLRNLDESGIVGAE